MYSLLGNLELSSKLFLKVKERIMDYGMKNLEKKFKNGEMEELKWKIVKPTIWTKVIDFHLFVLTLKNWVSIGNGVSKQTSSLLCKNTIVLLSTMRQFPPHPRFHLVLLQSLT